MNKLLIALTVLLSINAFAARTAEEEISRAKQKILAKHSKKARKDKIKAKYKALKEGLTDKMSAELDSADGIVPCTTDADCAAKNPSLSF